MRITFSPKISMLVILIAGLWAHNSEAQWIRVNGPYVQGGNQSYPQQLTINGDEALIATIDGIFISKDSGKTWLPINNGLPIVYITGVEALGSTFFAETYAGLYITSDEGAHWNQSRDLSLINSPVGCFKVFGNQIFVTADSGLFLSRDTGRSWQRIGPLIPSVYTMYAYDSYLFSGTPQGVFRSSDSGHSWVHSSTGINSGAEVLCFASIGSTLFAGANDSSIYLSNDSGKTWSNEGTTIPWYRGIYSMAVVGNDLIAVGNFSGLFRSSDTGKTWLFDTTIYPNIIDVDGLGMVGKNLVAASEPVLYSEDSGVTWKPSSSGFGYAGPNNIISFGGELVCTNGLSMYRSNDSGLNWDVLSDSAVGYDLENVGNDLILASHSGIYISHDSGVSWTLENDSAMDLGDLTTIGPSLFAISYSKGILFSSDEGATWDTIDGGLYFTTEIAAVGGSLIAFNAGQLYASMSRSSGWQQIDIDSGLELYISTWTVDGDKLYAITDNDGLVFTSDLGKTWISLPCPASPVGQNEFVAAGNYIFVATDDSIYFSIDAGHTWMSEINVPFTPALLTIADGYLFEASDENGLFRQSLPAIDDIVIENPSPENGEDFISINPNPATDRATINFSIAQASMVSLTMSDVTGKEFLILKPQWMEAGEHTTEWTTDGHADGMYVCRLEVNGTSSARKIILQK